MKEATSSHSWTIFCFSFCGFFFGFCGFFLAFIIIIIKV